MINANKMGSLVLALMLAATMKTSIKGCFAFVHFEAASKFATTGSNHPFFFALRNDDKTDIEVGSSRRNPFRQVDVDIEKASDCASNFGECPIEEVEELRDELHAHRVQNMVFGDCTSDGFKEMYLEEELSLQLDLLKKDLLPDDPYLFPLEYNNKSTPPTFKHDEGNNNDKEKNSEENLMGINNSGVDLFEELVEDGAVESLAMCGMIGLLMVAPQLI